MMQEPLVKRLLRKGKQLPASYYEVIPSWTGEVLRIELFQVVKR